MVLFDLESYKNDGFREKLKNITYRKACWLDYFN